MKYEKDPKIDFVITWVDGNDPKWLEEKNKYKNNSKNLSNTSNRFRDWDNLQYWFRAIEKFTPWVNRIHFVTYGHLPKWLNTNNSKLNVVKHEEFIPHKYLPTYNSHTIEFNAYRIKGLEEKFVLFNDDMFILKPMKQDDFFKKGLPCDMAIQNASICEGNGDTFPHILLNNTDLINKYFNKREVMTKHPTKWFSIKYGKEMLRNFMLLPWSHITGMWDMHLPHSYFKETFEKLWNLEPDLLDNTCSNKFRSIKDINHFVLANWQIFENKFMPRSCSIGKRIEIKDNYEEIYKIIIKQKYKMICLNDSEPNIDFERSKKNIQNAFDKILPNKSSFEI